MRLFIQDFDHLIPSNFMKCIPKHQVLIIPILLINQNITLNIYICLKENTEHFISNSSKKTLMKLKKKKGSSLE